MPDPKRRIMLVDDQPVGREGLALLVNQEPDLEVCGNFESSPQTARIAENLRPDIVIVSLSRHQKREIDLIKEIASLLPSLPVLVLSDYEEPIYVENLLRAGAKAYVLKREATSNVMNAIRHALNGRTYLSESLSATLLERFVDLLSSPENISKGQALSSRELLVLQLMGEGMTTRQIAEKLCVSIKTVETYRDRIKKKLNIDRHPELLQYAIHWVRDFCH